MFTADRGIPKQRSTQTKCQRVLCVSVPPCVVFESAQAESTAETESTARSRKPRAENRESISSLPHLERGDEGVDPVVAPELRPRAIAARLRHEPVEDDRR